MTTSRPNTAPVNIKSSSTSSLCNKNHYQHFFPSYGSSFCESQHDNDPNHIEVSFFTNVQDVNIQQRGKVNQQKSVSIERKSQTTKKCVD